MRAVGQIWRIHSDDQSAACLRAARGTPAKNDDINLLVDFYGGFWQAISMASVALFVVIGILAKALDIAGGHRWLLVIMMTPSTFFLLMAMTLIVACAFRRPRKRGLPGSGSDEIAEYLRASRFDAWVAVAAAVFASFVLVAAVLTA